MFNNNKTIKIFDNEQCLLGEGALWHPQRRQLFWFDINHKKMYSIENGCQKEWQFNECVSAAAWVDFSTLLISSESSLFTFDLNNSMESSIVELEECSKETRSNDGRADPWGGFWISTMDKNCEKPIGSIYRYYNGVIKKLFGSLVIPNSICFSAEDCMAYFSDTKKKIIYYQSLDSTTGWPEGKKGILANFSDSNLNPDGAVTDIKGNLWCAMWGASEIICLSKNGKILERIKTPVRQPTCPAFGGKNYNKLFFTSASLDLESKNDNDGKTFFMNTRAKGIPEPKVKI